MSRSVFRKKTPLSPSLLLSPFFFFCQTRLFRDFPLTSGLAVRQRRSGLTNRRAQGVEAGGGGSSESPAAQRWTSSAAALTRVHVPGQRGQPRGRDERRRCTGSGARVRVRGASGCVAQNKTS